MNGLQKKYYFTMLERTQEKRNTGYFLTGNLCLLFMKLCSYELPCSFIFTFNLTKNFI